LSMVPATAGAIDTTAIVKSRSQKAVLEVPRDGEGREGRETQDMSISFFISGMIFGLPLGLLLGSRVLRGWRGRQERQRAMDQLTEQFQRLFREIDLSIRPINFPFPEFQAARRVLPLTLAVAGYALVTLTGMSADAGFPRQRHS